MAGWLGTGQAGASSPLPPAATRWYRNGPSRQLPEPPVIVRRRHRCKRLYDALTPIMRCIPTTPRVLVTPHSTASAALLSAHPDESAFMFSWSSAEYFDRSEARVCKAILPLPPVFPSLRILPDPDARLVYECVQAMKNLHPCHIKSLLRCSLKVWKRKYASTSKSRPLVPPAACILISWRYACGYVCQDLPQRFGHVGEVV